MRKNIMTDGVVPKGRPERIARELAEERRSEQVIDQIFDAPDDEAPDAVDARGCLLAVAALRMADELERRLCASEVGRQAGAPPRNVHDSERLGLASSPPPGATGSGPAPTAGIVRVPGAARVSHDDLRAIVCDLGVTTDIASQEQP